MSRFSISTRFDAGAIEPLSLTDPGDLQFNIRKDNASDFAQWFYFALHGAAGVPVTLKFMNAGQCAYPEGWKDYQVVASHNRQHWFRIETRYDGTVMTARTTPQSQCIYFACFEPYSWEQHLDLLGSASESPWVVSEHLGHTAEGRDMVVLHITDTHSSTPAAEKKQVWLIARQHPGEAMAEWFAEGFLERLLDPCDPVSRSLLGRCIFHVVPNMNPDGTVHGNLRTNALGVNLNREWAEPSMQQSPEVFCVRAKMQETGVDMCLDIHGDERLPYNFVVGSEGTPGYSPRVADLENQFKTAWQAACPDFQDEWHYPLCPSGKANLSLATNWVAQNFGCLAFTIEMPFKDNAKLPDPAVGWNGERSRKLGASVLQALLVTV